MPPLFKLTASNAPCTLAHETESTIWRTGGHYNITMNHPDNNSPTKPSSKLSDEQCVKCGHFSTIDIHDEGECQVRGQSGFICGCKCIYPGSKEVGLALEPCKWCGDKAMGYPQFLDRDGVLCSLSGEPGILSHAYDDSWWPCLKFGVEMRCARVNADSAGAMVDQLWEALKAECCKSDQAEQIVFLSKKKFERALARIGSPAVPRDEAVGWLPIETAPKDKTLVLVALIKDGRVWRVSEAAFNGLGWYDTGGIACHWRTHWIPLPPAP